MDSSFNEMAIDMSFYEDGDSVMSMPDPNEEENFFSASPPLADLISPEGSPQRFRIINQNKNTPQKLHLNENNIEAQQNVVGNIEGKCPNFSGALRTGNGNGNGIGIGIGTGTRFGFGRGSGNLGCRAASSLRSQSMVGTAKTIRTFNSLSSESMDTSMDDDYIEYFEMENLEHLENNLNESLFNFPSNLNSLICGQIKNESPEEKSSRRLLFSDDDNDHDDDDDDDNDNVNINVLTNKIKTPEMHFNRRPSVRRCLSLLEDEKTPIRSTKASETNDKILKTPNKTLSISNNSKKNLPSTINTFKRPEAPTIISPRQAKRYRFSDKENFVEFLSTSPSLQNVIESSKSPTSTNQKSIIRKCMSMNDAEIMSALARSDNTNEPQLIGDFSGPFVLPLIEGRHRDLKSISSDTLAQLINGVYNDQIASYQIIDCRYPYEYDGGHIRGAKNLFTQEQIISEFLTKQKTEENEANKEVNGKKRHIIIFHCEFSSERGPKLSRFLRNNDRARNTTSYPALDYPEIYLLHNGYKEFFETHSELCDPASYRPMLEPSYNEAYRHFRAKSKSWNGGDGFGAASSRKKLYTEGRSLLYRL